MKKMFVLILISIISLSTYAQESNTFAITTKGDTVYMYSYSKTKKFLVWNEHNLITFRDKKGKKQFLKSKEIKVLINGRDVYLLLKDKNKSKKSTILQKVLAYNDSYILTAYITGMDHIYVYDREFNVIERYMFFAIANKKNRENSVVKVKEYITKYFKDCPYVSENFIKNINDENNYKISVLERSGTTPDSKNKHGLHDTGFSAYRCGDAKPLEYLDLRFEGGGIPFSF